MEKLQLDATTLPALLDARAATQGQRTLLKQAGGELTVAEVKASADRMARGLDAHGIGVGDHVAVMLPNCADFIALTFALARVGAVMVPVNTALHGMLLQHVLTTSHSAHMVIDEPLLGRLDGLEIPELTSIIVRQPRPAPLGGFSRPIVPLSRLLAARVDLPRPRIAAHSTQAIMYTSGTTGPSKGVIVPHALALTCAVDSLHFLNSAGKTIYCPLPLFHAAGLWDGMLAALHGGGALAIVERFSASRFWDDVRRFRAAVAMGVFSMIPILLNRPPRRDDRDNPLETFYMGKSGLDQAFYQRFGAHTVETYTSTEIGIGTASEYGHWRTGSCGQAHGERYEVLVVDEDDQPVPPGVVGELVVRPRQPWVMFSGYYGFGDATAHAFRNLWFHTGDSVRVDEDGYFQFVSRMKDAIRRRGENISCFELEWAINTHPAVLESAAFGVPSELGEEDVAVAVVLQKGASLAPEAIAAFCESRLPGYMVPRYVEILDALPRSSTEKLAKHVLRARGKHGVTADTWDCENKRKREQPRSEGAS